MPGFHFQSEVPAPVEEVFAWHGRPGAFHRLIPPWQTCRILEGDPTMTTGRRLILELRKGPLKRRWTVEITGVDEGRGFRDEQREGPFASWIHAHLFSPASGGGSIIEDDLEYELPMGSVGRAFAGEYVHRQLWRTFRHRHETTRNDLIRHGRFASRPRLRAAISGAGGLIGSRMRRFLESGGHEVVRLVRRTPAGAGEIPWDPARGVLSAEALEGFDAVVHLSGASIGSGRWTLSRKRALRDSRVLSTRLLAETLARLKSRPRVLIVSSAVGYYGDRGNEPVTEASRPGEGFLSDLCKAWEAAAAPARDTGIRVVHLRTGIVLSGSGGALARMLPAFKAGVAGPIGSGRQVMSWIGHEDMVGAIHHLLFSEDVAGPVNVTSPQPVTNAEFTETLARVLRRPALLPLPSPAVKAIFGEMGKDLLLGSARVLPARLEETGFPFLHPDLESALRVELGRWPGR